MQLLSEPPQLLGHVNFFSSINEISVNPSKKKKKNSCQHRIGSYKFFNLLQKKLSNYFTDLMKQHGIMTCLVAGHYRIAIIGSSP